MVRAVKISIIFLTLLLSACVNNLANNKAVENEYDYLGLQEIALGQVDGLSNEALQKLQQVVYHDASSYGFSITSFAKKYFLQGYFSFESDEQSNQIVYYVFDLLDNKGQRLHRVNGRVYPTEKKNNILQDEDYKEIVSQLFLQLRQWRLKLNQES